MRPDQQHSPSTTLADLGFTLTGQFIPFSQSQYAKEESPSLNWKLTLLKDGRVVLKDFDYMQGCAWAPAYKLSVAKAGGANSILRDRLIRSECETGKVAQPAGEHFDAGHRNVKPLPLPAIEDVLASLFMDASAIDSGSFKEWAADYGYDDDSIKARDSFEGCIEVGLKLRSALGPELFERGRELANEY